MMVTPIIINVMMIAVSEKKCGNFSQKGQKLMFDLGDLMKSVMVTKP